MPFVKVGRLADLPPGQIMEAAVDGAIYAICNANGTLYAVSGACPHRDGPLAQGTLHGYTLVCPWHVC